jgi:hypothetical protein
VYFDHDDDVENGVLESGKSTTAKAQRQRHSGKGRARHNAFMREIEAELSREK